MTAIHTESELLFLEDTEADDEPDHGVCPICYPKDTGKQIAICGVDVTGEAMMPKAELLNICKECLRLEIPHAIQHVLGRI